MKLSKILKKHTHSRYTYCMFHLYKDKDKEKTKLIYGERKQKVVASGGSRRTDWKVTQRDFLG